MQACCRQLLLWSLSVDARSSFEGMGAPGIKSPSHCPVPLGNPALGASILGLGEQNLVALPQLRVEKLDNAVLRFSLALRARSYHRCRTLFPRHQLAGCFCAVHHRGLVPAKQVRLRRVVGQTKSVPQPTCHCRNSRRINNLETYTCNPLTTSALSKRTCTACRMIESALPKGVLDY